MLQVVDCGVIEYARAWQQQREYFEHLLGDDHADDVLMLCEHPHVYTLGRSGSANNLLVNDEFLSSIGATYFKTDRGGDITYHGYGQLVAYPILRLERYGLSLKGYIDLLEQVIIDTIQEFGIRSGRLAGATGVWIDSNRKIAAIGVKASRYTTMHGIALNVRTDLRYFSYINPCGFVDKGVTSIEQESTEQHREKVSMENVKRVFLEMFERHFTR